MEQPRTPIFAREPLDPRPDPWRVAGMVAPEVQLADAAERGDFREISRRAFVGASFAGTLALAACASSTTNSAGNGRTLPKGAWGEPPVPRVPVELAAAPTDPAAKSGDVKADGSATSEKPADAADAQKAQFNPVGEAALPWAKPRFLWAKGQPLFGQLNPMLPVTCMTVHHDGLEELFWGTKPAEVASRLEHYRLGHLGRGWADIGYHLAIDRGGTLWQGRAIRWQGAHVQFHNEGNIGVLVMGNFDVQSPTIQQIATLRKVVEQLRATYGIKRGRVYTHKEWPNAQTACPGRTLQPRVEKLRKALGA